MNKNSTPFEIYPESETNFFKTNRPWQFTIVKNDKGETTAVILHRGRGLPVDEGKKLKISRAANERCLTALAAASLTTPLAQEAARFCQPIRRNQSRHRALKPFETNDARLFAAVNRGEWAIKGFRNRDIRLLLFGQTRNKKQERSQAAKLSRRLALLHAHGLLAKVPRSYRWQVTPKGRRILTALLAARQADTDKLISLAA